MQGHDVHVFTTPVDGADNSNVPLNTPVELDGVKVWYFPVVAARRLYRAPGLLAHLKQRENGFDVIHAHSVFLWPTWAAARASRSTDVPLVISPRGMLVREFIRRKSTFVKTAWIRVIERRNFASASVIHATSRAEAAELPHMGLELRRVEVIPNGIDIFENPPAANVPSNIESFVAGNQFVLYVGRISWEKGLDRLLSAMRGLPEAKLVVAGNDESGMTELLQRQARECGVHSRILFAGPVRGEQKRALYRHAAAFVLPSYSENFGNVVLEAMAEGCPVVVTEEVGAAEVVRQVNGGIVSRGDADSLANALRAMLADPATRGAMARRAHAGVRSSFSWQRVAEDMAALYSSLGEMRRTRCTVRTAT
jgi:glycosyltransferase involved in cell wall biosynthesis